MPDAAANHYATLGLDRHCTPAQIHAAYRRLAKQHHPDLNHGSPEAMRRTQELNDARETLDDPARRRAYDRELDAANTRTPPARPAKVERNIARDVSLRPEDFLRGVSLVVRVNDPANPQGPETCQLTVPAGTAPGTRFWIPRAGRFAGGFLQVRVRALPGFRFKVRGSDLRCDLRIKPERAAQGGAETIPGVTGSLLRVQIPRGAARGEIVRIHGEGLPKPRGGRGDLLVRITYRVGIHVSRRPGQ